MTNIQNAAKVALRTHVKQVLKSMTPADRQAQSEKIAAKLYASAAFRRARRVCIYLSMATEVDTLPILRTLFAHDKHVFVPCYAAGAGADMTMLRLHDLADYERLPLTRWHIRQPSAEDARTRETALAGGGLDLVLVPGVAFQRRAAGGGVARMGHGMGYYDRYLKRLLAEREGKQVDGGRLAVGRVEEKLAAGQTVLVGLAFVQQMVGGVPVDEHDVLLDEVLTADDDERPQRPADGI